MSVNKNVTTPEGHEPIKTGSREARSHAPIASAYPKERCGSPVAVSPTAGDEAPIGYPLVTKATTTQAA